MLNDVGLWRALTEPDVAEGALDGDGPDFGLPRASQSLGVRPIETVGDDAIASALEALGSRAVRRRIAWLGIVADAATKHSSALVRAAALRALIGSSGARAHAAIARGLDDDEATVREAAVQALRALASAEPARWIHAVGHSRADVRRSAVELGPPPGAEPYELPLIADETARPIVAQRIERWANASSGVPAFVVPLLFDATVRGWLPLQTTRAIVHRVATDRLANWLYEQPGRTEVTDPTKADESTGDPLDALLELEWSREAPTELPTDTIWWRLVGPVAEQFESLRTRLAASAWVVARKRGYWSVSGVAACLLFAPESLDDVEVPTEFIATVVAASVRTQPTVVVTSRRASRKRLAGIRHDRSPLTGEALLRCAFAAMMQRGNCFAAALDALGPERLADAIVEHPRQAALLFADPPPLAGPAIDIVAVARSRSKEAVAQLADALIELGGPAATTVTDLVGSEAALEALRLRCAEPEQKHVAANDPRIRLCSSIASAALPVLVDELLARDPSRTDLRRWLDAALATEPVDALARHITGRSTLATRPMRMLLVSLEARHGAAVKIARAALDDVRARALRDDPSRGAIERDDESEAELSSGSDPTPTPIDDPTIEPPGAQALDDLTYFSDEELEQLVKGFLRWPVTGVAAALELRDAPTPNPWLCAALLRAHDAPEHCARVLGAYWPDSDEMLEKLEQIVASTLSSHRDLGLLASAWLYRWERHAQRFVELAKDSGSLAQVLATVEKWPERLASRAWGAATRALESAAGGAGSALDVPMWGAVARLAINEMVGDDIAHVRDEAARFLAAASRAPASLAIIEPLRAEAIASRASLPPARSASLGVWLDRVRADARPIVPELLAKREQLERLRSGSHDSLSALIEELSSSDEGRALIWYALEQGPRPAAYDALVTAVAGWRGALAATASERIASGPVHLALEIERARARAGDDEAMGRATQRVLDTDETLEAAAIDAVAGPHDSVRAELAFAWLHARSPSVLRWAVAEALRLSDIAGSTLVTPERSSVLVARIEAALFVLGPSDEALRRRVARWLWLRGISTGFVLLVQQQLESSPGAPEWIASSTGRQLEATVEAAVTAGHSKLPEPWIVDLLRTPSIGPALAAEAWSTLLQWASQAPTRQAAINELNRLRLFRSTRAAKLRAVARVFAWGVQVGLVLTGRAMGVQLARDAALGYTRLDEDRVFVSALPLLRGERYGRAVVEGLLLHEFGHHRYHRGVEQREAWDQGFREGIGPLLNLVADEHLERNLRALDTEYGDRLKRLDAYAFQHMARPIAVATLFEVLRCDALSVLSGGGLSFAQDPSSVVLEHGRLLQSLERSGSSFARWVRALRMGLGDRHGDEKVSRALALFSGAKFRKSSMGELLEIARQVRAIFGDECRLLNVVSTHEDVGHGEEGELDRVGEGISDDEIRREVDRITNPRKSDDDGTSGAKPGGKRWINVTEGTDFDLIKQVVRVGYEPSKHRALADRVRRSAGTLRSYLERLGLHLQPQRLRLRGRRVDAPRTRALVTRGDPRVLIAREIQVKTDLFIGVVIDCSGSMASGENMPRARLFGALIAEAARAMPSVDVRIFGFTDAVIYDAGDSRHPAVHALEAGGGNNDSGALWHAANVARASNRRAKLLVMISDGLPTECSAASLKHLAVELTRRHKMCCAQIAVQPLPEVLFPNYVECDGPDTDVVVRRFGRIVEGLVKRAMGIP